VREADSLAIWSQPNLLELIMEHVNSVKMCNNEWSKSQTSRLYCNITYYVTFNHDNALFHNCVEDKVHEYI